MNMYLETLKTEIENLELFSRNKDNLKLINKVSKILLNDLNENEQKNNLLNWSTEITNKSYIWDDNSKPYIIKTVVDDTKKEYVVIDSQYVLDKITAEKMIDSIFAQISSLRHYLRLKNSINKKPI